MGPKKFQNDELKEFLNADPANDGSANVPLSIVKDLVISKSKLGMVYLTGSVAGYFLTLIVCAQCSIGLSPLAWKTASFFHSIPDPWCSLLCGAIFGIAPFFASLVLLTRFQHRYLLFRMTWVPVIVPIVASAILMMVGTPHSWAWQSMWLLAAILTPYVLEIGSGVLLRQTKWKPLAT